MGCNSLFSVYCLIFLFRLHQDMWGTAQVFQDLGEHATSSQEEQVAMGGDVTGLTNDWAHLGKAVIEP